MSLMTTLILVAAGLVGATGLILGLFLGVASEKFKVEVDEREAEVRAALPGSNCGACGFPGCDGCAKAIAKGQAPVNQCPVGGAPVAEKIAAIMGTGSVSVDNVKKVAHVHCQGDCDKAKQQAHYSGIAMTLWWFRAERKRLVLTPAVATAPVSRFAPLMPFM